MNTAQPDGAWEVLGVNRKVQLAELERVHQRNIADEMLVGGVRSVSYTHLVVNYFFFVAEEVREIMAELGIRKFDDLIGRADLLDMRPGIDHWKAKGLDFSKISTSRTYRPASRVAKRKIRTMA